MLVVDLIFAEVDHANRIGKQEIHLVEILNNGGQTQTKQDIPAPPALESTGTGGNYDVLYPDAAPMPTGYIKFSQTVEECIGCPYNMTTEDAEWLQKYTRRLGANPQLSEDNFEKIMWVFEEETRQRTPYAAVDNHFLAYADLQEALRDSEEYDVPDKAQEHTKEVYAYWKARREQCGGHSLQPSIKLETDQEIDTDGDPYVCFRRREARTHRKTRARDIQGAALLTKLRRDLEEGRSLVQDAIRRETLKTDLLEAEKLVFDKRARVKETKIKLGIGREDDEHLYNTAKVSYRSQRSCSSTLANWQQPKRQNLQPQRVLGPGQQLRLGRPDGRPIESDLTLLSDLMKQQRENLRREITSKVAQHTRWNESFEDLTAGPLEAVSGDLPGPGWQAAITQYPITPPSSVTSESFNHASPAPDKPRDFTVRYGSPPEEECLTQPVFRRRIGRNGRQWIDRRPGLINADEGPGAEDKSMDRWKYDQDDDDRQPVYSLDAYSTDALRYRSSIQYPPHLLAHQHRRVEERGQPVRTSPNASRNNPPVPAQQRPV